MAERDETDNEISGAAMAYQSALRVEIAALGGSRKAERARAALTKARRIVIVTKFRFMGDTVVATPFFSQLRRHFPHAEITLLTAPSAALALENCPDLNAIIAIEKKSGERRKHISVLLKTLQSGRYDAAFLLNRSLECAMIASVAGIPTRIGYVNEWRSPFLTLPIPYAWDRNEVDSHLDMLRALGLPVRDALPELWTTEAERARALEILTLHGWRGQDGGRPLIGVQPGANDPMIREWGAARYARVADALTAETGGSVVIIGGNEERQTADEMAGRMKSPVISLVGRLQLREALAVIGQCDLWLGNDSGLLHAAVSQRVPSVGIFGPNKVARWGYDTPRHRSLVVFPERPAKNDLEIRRCIDAIPESLLLETARQVLCPTATETEPDRLPYFSASVAQARSMAVSRR